jgi:hypothetical protein
MMRQAVRPYHLARCLWQFSLMHVRSTRQKRQRGFVGAFESVLRAENENLATLVPNARFFVAKDSSMISAKINRSC